MNQSNSKWQILFFRLAAIILVLFSMLWLTKLGIKLFVISSAIQPRTSEVPTVETADSYTIISKIIEETIIQDSTELILIENETFYGFLHQESEGSKSAFAEISNEIWIDFLQKNQEHRKLDGLFVLSKPYFLIDSNNREEINRALLFTKNIEQTPFLQFSEIGFNSKRDEALVHVSMFYLGNSLFDVATFGYGKYTYLKNIDGVWKILNEWKSFIT